MPESMPETFLILLAAGVMLAAAISDSRQVTLRWLRLAGILALAAAALSAFFYLRREVHAEVTAAYRWRQIGLLAVMGVAVLGQLAFVQLDRARVGRVLAWIAALVGIASGAGLLHELMVARGTAVAFAPKALAMSLQGLTCLGVAAMTGLVLMDMLLGHAYLTASRMTMEPFRRLNLALGMTLVLRMAVSVGVVMWLQTRSPVEMLWEVQGIFIGTRWLVGLVVPAIFVYMAQDCIRRRSTQSATGILYVAGVLVFIGEIVGLYLAKETGLPF